MRPRSPARDQSAYRCRRRQSRLSSCAGHLDAAIDDGLLECFYALMHGIRNEATVAFIVDVAHSALTQSEGKDAAPKRSFACTPNGIVHGSIHALDHRGEHMAGRFVVLVCVHADGQLPRLTRSLEDTKTGGAGRVKDHVHTRAVLTECQLFSF